MKKLFNILLVAIFCVAYAGCSDDDDNESSSLKVIKADTIFDAEGGSGTIEVAANGSITATSSEEWCTATVSGNSIKLSLTGNTEITGRMSLITIKSGDELLPVRVTQSGAIMWLKDFSGESLAFVAEGNTLKSEVRTSFAIVVKSKPDWITYKFENDSLYLTAEAGIPRKGSITFTSEGREITYNLIQVSYAGLLGEWEMKFNNPSNSNIEETTTVTMTEKVKNSSFVLEDLIITGSAKAEILVDFSPLSNGITISAGQYLYTASDGRLVYLSLRSATGNYTWGTTAQLGGTLDIATDGTVTYTLADNGTWSNGAAGFGFYLYTGEPSSTTATGSSYRRFMNVVLTKK